MYCPASTSTICQPKPNRWFNVGPTASYLVGPTLLCSLDTRWPNIKPPTMNQHSANHEPTFCQPWTNNAPTVTIPTIIQCWPNGALLAGLSLVYFTVVVVCHLSISLWMSSFTCLFHCGCRLSLVYFTVDVVCHLSISLWLSSVTCLFHCGCRLSLVYFTVVVVCHLSISLWMSSVTCLFHCGCRLSLVYFIVEVVYLYCRYDMVGGVVWKHRPVWCD